MEPNAWEAERESLLDEIAERHAAFIYRSEWSGTLSMMGGSGCRQAALEAAERAHRFWVRARECLEDHEYERDRERIEAHQRMVDNLIAAASDARMDVIK